MSVDSLNGLEIHFKENEVARMAKIKVVCVLLAVLCAATARGQIAVNSRTTLLIDPREPAPIQKAAHDLASDMTKVFGRAPHWADSPAQASSTTICIAFSHNLPRGVSKPVGWEALRIQADRDPWPKSHVTHVVVLTGSDVRRVTYAIYQFSQQFLGVDPLYWWTDHEPRRRTVVSVPDRFVETSKPTFRYRGWFINDEDLLTGWRPGTANGT